MHAMPRRRLAWYLGEERVGLLASRGVRLETGLRPPPHLVGERARALEVLAAGGLVCASALGVARGATAARARDRRRSASGSATSRAPRRWSSGSRLAGYERVERVEERGQFAVRGGIVDVFPSTGREPVRIELFGDEVESIRAFSAFTQRALRPLEEATRLSGGRAPARSRRPELDGQDEPGPGRSRSPLPGPPTSSGRPTRFGRYGGRSSRRTSRSRARSTSTSFRRAAVRLRGAAPGGGGARTLGGRARPGRLRPRRQPGRRHVRAPRRGAAHEGDAAPDRAELLEPGDPLPDRARRWSSPSPLRAAASSRAISGSSSCPTRRSSASARRAPTPGSDARSRASPTCGTGDYVVHEDHGIGRLLGFETKTVAGVTRDYLFLAFRGDDRLYVPHEQIGKVSRYVGADGHAPALLEARRQGLAARQDPRAGPARASLRASCSRSTRSGSVPRASPTTSRATSSSSSRRASHTSRRPTSNGRSRPSRRTSRRPGRWTGSSAETSASGRPRSAVRAAFAVAVDGKQTLVLAPTTILAQQHWNTFRERYRDFPITRRDGLAVPQAGRREADPAPTSREGKVDVLIGTHRVLSRDVAAEGARPRHRRRGAALRRRPEGAPAPAPARGGRARPHRDADPAHAAHVALRPARHQRDRDAAGGPAADPDARRRVRRGDRPARAPARAGAGRAVVLPAQPRRDDRGARRGAAAALSRAALPRRPRPAAGARARGADARLPRRRRRRPRLDDDHRVGPRHPAGEHARGRARRCARSRPALPDPRAVWAEATLSRTPTSSIPTRRS